MGSPTRRAAVVLGAGGATGAWGAVTLAAGTAAGAVTAAGVATAAGLLAVAVQLARRAAGTRRTARRYRASFAAADAGLLVVDAAGTATLANTRLGRVLGLPTDPQPGQPAGELLACTADPGSLPPDALAALRRVKPGRYTFAVAGNPAGRHVAVIVTSLDVDREPGARLAIVRDITASRRLQEELTRRANSDELTGLANRAVFTDAVDAAVTPRGDGLPVRPRVAVLFLDLDGFKTVNDTLGHAAGDLLLGDVADRLRACIRAGDVIGRLGGDEFGVLLRDIDRTDQAHTVAARMLAQLTRPFRIGWRQVHVSGSIGIAVATAGVTGEELLRNADLAMYRAKDRGRGRAAVYHPRMHADAVARAELEAEMRDAIAGGEFEVHYQPIVRLDDAAPVAVEALVRWRHPTRGLLTPDYFVPLAETTGLIGTIGAYVLSIACSDVAGWRQQLDLPLRVAVNLSTRQLDDDRVVGHVATALGDARLPADALTLEITETALIDPAASVDVLGALNALGVQLALDDFGTGFSSLSHLRSLPAQVLKIDRSYVSGLGSDEQLTALTGTVVALARTLGLSVVAEGVETAAQRTALEAMGCPYAQGYLFSPPQPAGDTLAWLQARC